MIGVGIVGYGYWGPNLLRSFLETPGVRVCAVCDLAPARLAEVAQRFPGMLVTSALCELLAQPQLDAVAIATPVASHYPLALAALRAGKHVLVEKPLTACSALAAHLISEAQRLRRTLLVDHTFLYSGAVRKLRELIEVGALGQIYYYDSVRINLGLFRHDVNVVWDLAVHDLAIIDHLLGEPPCSVAAVAARHIPGLPENIAYLTLRFPHGQIAHIHVNWLAPTKVRRAIVGGSRKMVVYDDLEPTEKLRIYDHGLDCHPGQEGAAAAALTYRRGDVWIPQLDPTEPLRREVKFFLDCVEHDRQPEAELLAGLRIVRILEAATRSIQHNGAVVELTLSQAARAA